MLWLDAALVTVTIGTALIIISPLARLMGLYGPTKLVPHGYVLGMYGRPTWRFWALIAFFFAVHSASHFEKGHLLSGGAWAAMCGVYLVFVVNAARQGKGDEPAKALTSKDAKDDSE